MESNWRVNIWRYGLANLWEIWPQPQPRRIGVSTENGPNYPLFLAEPLTFATRWIVLPVDTQTKRILLTPTPPIHLAWGVHADYNVWRDRPVNWPWDHRVDPIN